VALDGGFVNPSIAPPKKMLGEGQSVGQVWDLNGHWELAGGTLVHRPSRIASLLTWLEPELDKLPHPLHPVPGSF